MENSLVAADALLGYLLEHLWGVDRFSYSSLLLRKQNWLVNLSLFSVSTLGLRQHSNPYVANWLGVYMLCRLFFYMDYKTVYVCEI